jgi:two-component system response regulator HydG
MESSKNSPKMILVVDDDPGVSRAIKAQLEFSGYTVTCKESGEKALEVIKGGGVFAVFLDLGLSGMDGFKVLERIKHIKPELPIIMVTGSHAEADGRRAIELGAWDYVTKPVDFDRLKNLLLFLSS